MTRSRALLFERAGGEARGQNGLERRGQRGRNDQSMIGRNDRSSREQLVRRSRCSRNRFSRKPQGRSGRRLPSLLVPSERHLKASSGQNGLPTIDRQGRRDLRDRATRRRNNGNAGLL